MKRPGFHMEWDKIQSLDANIVNMMAESLNFWLTKFVEEGETVSPQRHYLWFASDLYTEFTNDLYIKIVFI